MGAGADLFAEFVANPVAFGGGADVDAQRAGAALEVAEQRRGARPAPLLVTGIHPATTAAVAAALARLPGFFSAGAGPLPALLVRRMQHWPAAEQAVLADALHLLEGWAQHAGRTGLRAVRPGRVTDIPRYRRWDPGCFVVHAFGDPREPLLGARGAEVGAAARAAAVEYAHYRDAGDKADHELRLDELRADPERVLSMLLHVLGERLSPGDMAAAAAAVGAALPIADVGADATPQQRRRLHADLHDVSVGLGYPPDDCMGAALPPLQLSAPRTLDGAAVAALGALDLRFDGDGAWQPQAPAADEVHVASGVAARLRVRRFDTAARQALGALGPDDLDSLCLAHAEGADDEGLQAVVRLTGLRELDLAGTAVTDRGLALVAGLGRLGALSILDTAVTGAGVAAFRRHVPGCTVGGPAA